YDFIVAPGADPGRIRLAYKGAERMRVDSSGDLILTTPGRRPAATKAARVAAGGWKAGRGGHEVPLERATGSFRCIAVRPQPASGDRPGAGVLHLPRRRHSDLRFGDGCGGGRVCHRPNGFTHVSDSERVPARVRGRAFDLYGCFCDEAESLPRYRQ